MVDQVFYILYQIQGFPDLPFLSIYSYFQRIDAGHHTAEIFRGITGYKPSFINDQNIITDCAYLR